MNSQSFGQPKNDAKTFFSTLHPREFFQLQQYWHLYYFTILGSTSTVIHFLREWLQRAFTHANQLHWTAQQTHFSTFNCQNTAGKWLLWCCHYRQRRKQALVQTSTTPHALEDSSGSLDSCIKTHQSQQRWWREGQENPEWQRSLGHWHICYKTAVLLTFKRKIVCDKQVIGDKQN